MDRKLAAILAADVVGYSSLMERDEKGTVSRLKAYRTELFEPEIRRYHGRVFKLMGDGLLAEFPSVVDAVECAVAVQKEMAKRNEGVASDERIDIRIGVNLGDVLIEGRDRHGEGVIIAARLEQLAEPGGIYVSQTVVDHLSNKLPIAIEALGEHHVKNIAKPVTVYRVNLEGDSSSRFGGLARRKTGERTGWPRRWGPFAIVVVLLIAVASAGLWFKPWEPKFEPDLPLPDKPSIAVMPFTNMSGDPQQEYFANGMTDNLITDLSRVSGLFVIARNSTFNYKGKTIDPRRIARELGVRYVLEGSIQWAENSVRINAQLIDALDGGNVWADRFDGSIADVFSLQDRVTNSTADALAVRLSSSQQEAISQKETNSPAAYDAFLRGWEHYRRTTPGDYAKAIPFFEEAIKLDPNYHRAYAALAMVYVVSYDREWLGSMGITDGEARIRAQQYLRIARKQPTALAHQAAGYAFIERGALMDAFTEFKQATELDPSDSWSYAFAALALTAANRPAEALPYIKTAMRLDPRPPALFLYYQGLVEFNLEHFEEAAASLEKAGRLNPDDQYPFLVLAATYGHLSRREDAIAAVARYNELTVKQGGIPAAMNSPRGAEISKIVMERFKTGLRAAGVPDSLARGEFAERNRLSPQEVRSLLFGHRLHGRPFRQTSENRSGSVTTDGIAAFSGDWVTAGLPQENGRVNFRNDELCITFGPTNYCGIVLRNPGGSRASENEFIWRGYPFSQVE